MADGEEISEIKNALRKVRRRTEAFTEDTRLPLPEEIKADYTPEEHSYADWKERPAGRRRNPA